ncbi:MAG: potassium channel protein [Nitrospiraceae bacterium]|nr:MAG: potassium channel protein [Nitrospiraceae bacterium]
MDFLEYFFAIIHEMIKRLITALILLAIVIEAGTIGYVLIEKWGAIDSLYMTVITIASVGFMEVNPLSQTGRIFTIFLIIFGIGTLTFGISTFTAFLVEGELSEILRRRKMEKNISGLKGHYIVCGMGKIGRHIIEELYKTERLCVAIDKNEEECKRLAEEEKLFIKGDATSSSVLRSANIAHAKGVFCALPTDAENLLLILTARGISPSLKIVARAEEDESEEKMRRAGADGVVMPEFIGGLRMTSAMVRPEAVTFLDKMLKDQEEIYRVEDVFVDAGSALAGKTLKTSGLMEKKGFSVVALRKGDKYMFNPSCDERIETGDAVILIGESKSIREVKAVRG